MQSWMILEGIQSIESVHVDAGYKFPVQSTWHAVGDGSMGSRRQSADIAISCGCMKCLTSHSGGHRQATQCRGLQPQQDVMHPGLERKIYSFASWGEKTLNMHPIWG